MYIRLYAITSHFKGPFNIESLRWSLAIDILILSIQHNEKPSHLYASINPRTFTLGLWIFVIYTGIKRVYKYLHIGDIAWWNNLLCWAIQTCIINCYYKCLTSNVLPGFQFSNHHILSYNQGGLIVHLRSDMCDPIYNY